MVIEEGRADVTHDGEHVADLGEIAALECGQRNASVVARSPMCLVVMTTRDMRQLAASIPDLGQRLRATASQRHPLTQS